MPRPMVLFLLVPKWEPEECCGTLASLLSVKMASFRYAGSFANCSKGRSQGTVGTKGEATDNKGRQALNGRKSRGVIGGECGGKGGFQWREGAKAQRLGRGTEDQGQ